MIIIYYYLERIGRTSNSKYQSGKWTAWKEKKTPDPPGLEPGTLLVMSNALTTELWDQAEPRRRWQVLHSKGSSQHVPHILMALGSFSLPEGTNHGQFLETTRGERKWLNFGKDWENFKFKGLEWRTCQRLLGSAWSHSSVVRALLMTSRVPGSSPGGSGVFFSFQAVHFPDWSFEFIILLILLLILFFFY